MKVSRIRIGFQIGLHVVLITHVIGYYFWARTSIGALDFQSFFHDFLGKGLLTAGAILTLAAFLLTLILGRVFCSWGCHFGAFQDTAAWVLRKLGWRPPQVHTRFLHWTPYVLLLWIFLLPAVESWRQSGWWFSGFDLAVNAPWATLPGWIGTVVTFAACGVGILLFLGTRGFCRFVCPYGAVFRILDPVARYRIRKRKPCGGDKETSSCSTEPAALEPSSMTVTTGLMAPATPAPCTLACPTAIAVHEEVSANGAVWSRDCVRCHLCIEACPQQALEYSFRPLPVLPEANTSYRPPPPTFPLSREILVAAFTAVAFVAWDMTVAAHFLAAVLALGEGFLALLALETVTRKDFSLTARLPLRRGGRWTPAGAAVLGLFFLGLVPLAQGVAFKTLRGVGDAAFEEAFPRPEGGHEITPWGGLQNGLDPNLTVATDLPSLRRAQRTYVLALKLFPDHFATLRRLVLILALQEEDLDVLPYLKRLEDDPDPRSRELVNWVRNRSPEVEAPRPVPETGRPGRED